MNTKKFLVCGNEAYGTGHSVNNKIVVIEVEVDNEGRYATVIAPPEFVKKWPTVKVAGSMEEWVECEGPARLLTHVEWKNLLPSTKSL